MNDKIIHTCVSDENGKHIKGLCCTIEDLQKENARLREALEKISNLKEDVGYYTVPSAGASIAAKALQGKKNE